MKPTTTDKTILLAAITALSGFAMISCNEAPNPDSELEDSLEEEASVTPGPMDTGIADVAPETEVTDLDAVNAAESTTDAEEAKTVEPPVVTTQSPEVPTSDPQVEQPAPPEESSPAEEGDTVVESPDVTIEQEPAADATPAESENAGNTTSQAEAEEKSDSAS